MAEQEVKYIIPGYRTALARQALQRVCVADPKYPGGRISSIYYDTRDWWLLGEKRNSDYLKTKIRLRWYGTADDWEAGSGAAILEAKLRTGCTRKKIRVSSNYSGADLQHLDLQDPVLRRIPLVLAQHGLALKRPLHLL